MLTHSTTPAMNESKSLQALDSYKFYHIIKLTDTISTPGNPAYQALQDFFMKRLRSLDLKDKRVLDIGCRDGLFSFAAEAMGAEVIAIDNDISKPATEFLIPFFQSSVQMHEMNVYDLKPESFGLFDVVIFPGVLYHLRYPFWGLRAIREVLKVGGELLIETALWDAEPNNAMLFCPIGEDSPFYPDTTSCTFFNEKGIADTLRSLGFEQIAVDFLSRTEPSDPLPELQLRDFIRHPRNSFRVLRSRLADYDRLGQEPAKGRPPIKSAHRAVIYGKFAGFKKESVLGEYWESVHGIHTNQG